MTLSLLQKDTQDAVCASDCKDHAGIVVCCKHYPVHRCFADLLLLQHALCWLNSVQDRPSAPQCSLLLMYLLLCIVKPLACQQSPPDTHHTKALISTSCLAHACHLQETITAAALLDSYMAGVKHQAVCFISWPAYSCRQFLAVACER